MRIAVIANGAMGAAVAQRLGERGVDVFTCLAGRSDASRARAEQAGTKTIDDDGALIDRCDAFLSIVPPAHAVAVAERFAPHLGHRGDAFFYADLNAVCPATTRTIGDIIGRAGVAFVDGGIIGGPPRSGAPGPRIYASGDAASRFAELGDYGLDIRVLGGGIGAASALKLSYAALTKGLTALGFLAARGAIAAGVADALSEELAVSQTGLAGWLAGRLPNAGPKAYRFVGEMEEIARYLGPDGGAETFGGAAECYRDVARLVASNESSRLAALSAVFERAKKAARTP